MSQAFYLKLTTAELKERAGQAVDMLAGCTVCAQECRVNRLKGEPGI